MTDDDIDRVLSGGDFDLLSVKLFHHVIRCAHRGPLDQWIINLSGQDDDPELQKAFVGAVFRALLTPVDHHRRSGDIQNSIDDTTTGPIDGGK